MRNVLFCLFGLLLPIVGTCHIGSSALWRPLKAIPKLGTLRLQSEARDQMFPIQEARVRCVGVDVASRACHFKNLYYDRLTRHFVLFSQPSLASQDMNETGGGRATDRRDVHRGSQFPRRLDFSGPLVPSATKAPFLQLGGCAFD
jgi:hypothetical protein